MKKVILTFALALISATAFSQNDTTIEKTLKEVSIVFSYRVKSDNGSLVTKESIEKENNGKEPCFIFAKMPSIFAYGDNGSEFGYGYMRIRGLDQTHTNVTLDGMPWNEAEDFGCYFANSPDLMSSMHSIKVERGASVAGNGTAAFAGNISLESVDLKKDTTSSVYLGFGSFNSRKASMVYNMGVKKGWGLHIKTTVSGTDGYKYNSYNNSHAFTLKTGYFFNNNHQIDFLTMNGFHKNGQGYEGVSLEELRTDPKTNGCSPNDIDAWKQTVNKIQYNGIFDKFVLNASVYFFLQDGWYNFDWDNYNWRMIDDTRTDTTNSVYSYGLTHYFYGSNVAGKYYFDNLMLSAGVNAYKFTRRHFLNNGSVNIDQSEYYDNNGYKNDVNTFIKAKYELGRITATSSLQYRYTDFSYIDNQNSSNSFNKERYNTYWNFLNYDFGLNFKTIGNDKVYLRYTKVGREPMRSDMFGGNEWFPDTLLTNTPEIVHDWELGYDINSDRLKLNANMFLMHFQDELVLNGKFSTNGLPLHENIDESYKFGVELSARYALTQNINLINSSSLSKNTMYVNDNWRNHTYSPNILFNQDIEYTFGKYKLGFGFTYRDKMYIDIENEHSIDNAISLNAYAQADFDKITMSVRMNNITNNQNFCGAVVGASDKMMYLVDIPFNVWFDVRYKF